MDLAPAAQKLDFSPCIFVCLYQEYCVLDRDTLKLCSNWVGYEHDQFCLDLHIMSYEWIQFYVTVYTIYYSRSSNYISDTIHGYLVQGEWPVWKPKQRAVKSRDLRSQLRIRINTVSFNLHRIFLNPYSSHQTPCHDPYLIFFQITRMMEHTDPFLQVQA